MMDEKDKKKSLGKEKADASSGESPSKGKTSSPKKVKKKELSDKAGAKSTRPKAETGKRRRSTKGSAKPAGEAKGKKATMEPGKDRKEKRTDDKAPGRSAVKERKQRKGTAAHSRDMAADHERPVITAKAKYVRTSSRKARVVAEQIRGKTVEEARSILMLSTRGAAKKFESLLNSAVANAEHNLELDEEDLAIRGLEVNEGPTLKRFRPRAMGRATPIHKRTSHLTLSLTTFGPDTKSGTQKAG